MSAALLSLMAVHLAQSSLIWLITELVLRRIDVGGAHGRAAFAGAAFYACVALPLAALLPSQLNVTAGGTSLRASAWVLPSDTSSVSAGILWVVAAIALARLALTLWRAIQCEALARRAEPMDARDLGLPANVRVAASDEISGPMVAGVLRSVILVPHPLVASPDLRTLLAHEHVHLERRDVQRALRQRVITDLFWWNPFVRLIGHRLAEQRELVCDEAAVRHAGAPAFARALIAEAERHCRPSPLAAAARGGNLELRLERLCIDRVRTLAPFALCLALALACAAVTTPRRDAGSVTHITINST